MKKAIAMRCTKEQYEAIKPKLNELDKNIGGFGRLPYLTNFIFGKENNIGNVFESCKSDYNREVFETWNEKVFLSACGIETEHIPTLEEVKDYFKDADMVEDALGNVGHVSNINKIETHLWGDDCRICNEGFSGNIYLWSREEGYSKILTYKEKKEPEYVITESQINEIKNTLHVEKIDYLLDKWFPNASKGGRVELEVGKFYKHKEYPKFLTFINSDFTRYGFDVDGNWFDNAAMLIASVGYSEATPEEITEALTKEAVNRYKVGDYFKNLIGGNELEIEGLDFKYGWEGRNTVHEENSEGILFEDGVWAEIIPTISKEDAEKELGKKILN